MKKPLRTDSRLAWVLSVQLDDCLPFRNLLGRYSFPGADRSHYPIRLFPTRRDAENAKQTCGHKDARIVRVRVTIEEVTA